MKKTAISTCAMLCTLSAFGAGFQVLEQGASNMGTALAGSITNANSDASAAFWNPSAVIFSDIDVGVLKFDAGMNFVVPNFEFNNKGSTNPEGGTGGNGGNAGEVAYIPNGYGVYRLTEDLAFTFSMTSTFGLETDYDSDWVGRYHGIKSDLLNIDLNPSVAYKLTDWLSVSVGVSAQWMHAELTQSIGPGMLATFSGDSWSIGMNAGMTVKYCEDGRFAFGWRSQVSHKLEGNMKVNGGAVNPIYADLNTPHVFTFGVYQKLRGDFDKIAVMADYSYTCWSSFDVLDIRNANTGQSIGSTEENWKDVSRIAVGMHYYYSDDIMFRFGTAWDESPIKSAGYRTPRIPCTDRIWLSAGIGYKFGNFNVDLGYTYIIFYNSAGINAQNAMTGNVVGDYDGNAHLVSVSFGFKW